jgi:hypothetical protein
MAIVVDVAMPVAMTKPALMAPASVPQENKTATAFASTPAPINFIVVAATDAVKKGRYAAKEDAFPSVQRAAKTFALRAVMMRKPT